MALGNLQGTVGVYEVGKPEPVAVLDLTTSVAGAVAFSADGARLATGDRDGRIHIWETEEFEKVAELTGHEGYVFDLAWSPDGERLVSGSGDTTIRIWETQPSEAREEAKKERARIVAEVEPLVVKWLEETRDPDAVVEKIEEEGRWGKEERRVAFQVLLGECVGGGEGEEIGN